jgi:hypothetical protein
MSDEGFIFGGMDFTIIGVRRSTFVRLRCTNRTYAGCTGKYAMHCVAIDDRIHVADKRDI